MRSTTYFKSTIMKILFNYLQLINVFNSFDIEVPDNIASVFKFQSSANSPKQALFPLNCVYGIFNSNQNLFLLNSVFICGFSLFYPILVSLFLLLRGHFQKQDKEKFRYTMKVSVLIVCYTLQPFFLNFFLASFNCEEIERKFYLNDFLTEECWTAHHLSILYYLIIPFLLIWSFFLPIWTFFSLKRNKKIVEKSNENSPKFMYSKKNTVKIHDKNFATNNSMKNFEKKVVFNAESMVFSNTELQNPTSLNEIHSDPYSFITDGYDNHTYYWEFVMLIQKILVIISITFIQSSDALLCLFLCLFFAFIVIQILMKPFKSKILNFLQLYGYITNFLVVFFCLCYKFRVYLWETFFYLALIIVLNMAFLLFWGILYLQSSKAIFLKIMAMMGKYCPLILRFSKKFLNKLREKSFKSKIFDKSYRKRKD